MLIFIFKLVGSTVNNSVNTEKSIKICIICQIRVPIGLIQEVQNIMTNQERQTIQNTKFFQLKRSATEKVIATFSSIQEKIKASKAFQNFPFPSEMDTEIGKISKGENYNGLPYVILDFPRFFSQKGVFAFRVMFHWGHGFYATLHLSGQYFDVFQLMITDIAQRFIDQDIWIFQADEEWIHEVEFPYFIEFDEMKVHLRDWQTERRLLKIASRLELEEFNQLEDWAIGVFELFFNHKFQITIKHNKF